MKNYKNITLDYTTSETFTAADGSTVRMQELLNGITNAIRWAVSHTDLEEEDIEDAAQDAALRLWEIRDTYDPRRCQSPEAFGYLVAASAMSHKMEKVRNRMPALSSLAVHGKDGKEFIPGFDATFRSNEFAADNELTAKELEECVAGALESAGPKARRAFELSQEGRKSGEVAKILGCTSQAVSNGKNRAKSAIKEALEADFGFTFGKCA